MPERHLARFVVEVIDGLDVRAMCGDYRGSGSASYHPSLLPGLLVYGYATGVFSSRKLERATHDSVAFRFIAANEHPDHDTIAAFRRRFLKQIEALFVQVLLLAREMGVLKMGTVALDGTKIHANASRHSALSYEHAGKIEAQLKAEVAELLAKADAADAADVPDGMSIPEELVRREERLRYERELAEHEAKLAARAARTAETGKKPRGKPPEPPAEGPLPKDQINLTDEDSRIMPVAGRGFDQCYNAQAAVAAGRMLVVTADVVQAPNDKQQIEPTLDKLEALPAALGETEALLANAGYFSVANVEAWCEGGGGAGDRDGPPAAPSASGRTLREDAGGARESDASRGDGASAEDAGRAQSLRSAQTDPGAGVRPHQIRARVPSVLDARTGKGARRVEPREDGLEHQANVRPQPRLRRTQPADAPQTVLATAVSAVSPRLGRQ